MEKNYEKLKGILSEMFQLDQTDLDFGIYRIMNHKRDEIEKFLNIDLLPQVKQQLEIYSSSEEKVIEEELEEVKKKLDELEIIYEDNAKYMKLKSKLDNAFNLEDAQGEVYSHLANFFSRYYKDGDFISLRRYKKDVYAIPYEGEEVKLHWANSDQYYIKTSEYFKDYSFKLENGKEVCFKLVEAETEQDNKKEQEGKERRFIIYKEESIVSSNNQLIIQFEYKVDKDKQNKLVDEAVETISQHLNESEELTAFKQLLSSSPTEKNKKRILLEKYLNDYVSRNTFDYFIHKDLGGFLRRELDFYIKNEIMFLDDINTENEVSFEKYLTKIKVIKNIGEKIITFLAQIEEFQKKLWLKKKFIYDTNYCITLDRIPEELYPKIIENKEQIEEWIKLFAIDEIKGDLVNTSYTEPLTIEFLKKNPYLVLDTVFFDEDFKDEIIERIDNLDENIDGLLVHSENFQALNLLQEKYRERVDCLYIDPPYNTDGDGFLYKDNYRESSWLSMMYDRIKCSKVIQSLDSISFQSIGNQEYDALSMLNNMLSDNPEKRNVIHWKKNQKPQNASGTISESAEYILVNFGIKIRKLKRAMVGTRADDKGSFKPSPLFKFDGRERRIQIVPKGTIVEAKVWNKGKLSAVRNVLAYIEILDEPNVVNGILQNDVRVKGEWTKTDTYGEYSKMVGEGRLFINSNGFPNEKAYRDENSFNVHTNLWTEFGYNEKGKELLDNLFGVSDIIKYPKPVELLNEVIKCSTENNSIIMDYFSGSGTTGHATIELNKEDNGDRKYILIEMGEHFNTITKPRIQKVVYSRDWKGGKPISREGISHIFKYFRLESYEDTLNNLNVKLNEQQVKTLEDSPDLKEKYMLSYMLDKETEGSMSLLNIDKFKNPFNYQLKINNNLETQNTKIDLVETFNYLLGLIVESIERKEYFNTELNEEKIKLQNAEKDNFEYVFKKVEGKTLDGEKVLIIWRTMTDDIVKDNLVLDEYFDKKRYNANDFEYDKIYVNGDNNLPNMKLDDDMWKVILIEEEFKKRMFDIKDI